MRQVLAVLFVLLGVGVARAEPPEVLGPPTPLAPPVPIPTGVYKPSRYAVWQYYGVDRSGYFRPRVVATPYGGGYYLYNGAPYLTPTTRPLDYMPYATE